MMTHVRVLILSVVLLLPATSAFAQDQAPAKTEAKPAAAIAAQMEDISNWTKKQWYAAKAKWVKEKVKWADCQAQAAEKKLVGRKSWPVLYGCMTK